MSKSTVYYTREITPAALVKIFQQLGVQPREKVGVKISTGEAGNPHYLQPSLIADLVKSVDGTIIECNVAYAGGRDQTKQHLETAREHGFTEIANVDIMDADGDLEIPTRAGSHLPVDLVGKNLQNYDTIINLAHFKGHEMAGFGGVIKNQSIGFASARGKAYIHTAGRTQDPVEMMTAFDDETIAARLLAPQDTFLEIMAETAQAVADYLAQQDRPIVYINVINNLSVDCDCAAEPEAPCMQDLGIVASTDPVAADQAALDLVLGATDDPGCAHFTERVNAQHGPHVLEHAEKIGLGSRDYQLVELS